MRQKKNLIHTLKSYNLYTIFRFYIMREALKHKPYDPYVHPFFSPNQTLYSEIENHGGTQNRKYFSLQDKEDIENFILNAMLCKGLGVHTCETTVSRFKLEGRQIKWFKYINNPSMLMTYAIHRKYGLYNYKPRKIE